jgi:hypothetical protein
MEYWVLKAESVLIFNSALAPYYPTMIPFRQTHHSSIPAFQSPTAIVNGGAKYL